MTLLNKAGYPSSRNLAKPFRHPRQLADGSPHPLDRMFGYREDKKNLDENGNPTIVKFSQITNGSLGMITMVKRGVPSIILKAGCKSTPGKSKQKAYKKPGSKVSRFGKYEHVAAHKVAVKNCIEAYLKLAESLALRFDLKTREGVTPIHQKLYATIGLRLKSLLSQDEWNALQARRDARVSSILGMKRKGKLHGVTPKKQS